MCEKKTFFASSNSASGFQSYFDLIYNSKNLEKLYIIKGGPGTGKSNLMKSIAKAFDDSERLEYFLCSSDPDSLDGIIIENKIAVIDGTSPHTVEAKYPGAVEIIVDTATGINDKISNYRKEIFELCDKKSAQYKIAYSYLKSAGVLKTEYSKMITEGCCADKLEAAVGRFFKQNVKKSKNYNETIRLTDGITPKGIYKTNSFEKNSERKCILVNYEGFEPIIFNEFLKNAKEYGLRTYISFDPLLPYAVNGLYFPDESLCITCYSKAIHGEIDYDKYKVFNAERFVNKEILSSNRSKLRFSYKSRNALIEEAICYLKEASKTHMLLEKLYIENMDYKIVKERATEIAQQIANYL